MRNYANLIRQAVQNPSWFVENLRMQRLRRLGHHRSLNIASAERSDPEQTLMTLLGLEVDGLRALLNERYVPSDSNSEFQSWNASNRLLEVLWVTVRSLKPAIVVETGVARGFSSATILAALRRNGRGVLHSVDLPALGIEKDSFTGRAVPQELREGWRLHLGPSRILLPKIVKEVGSIDIFLHDADHTYESQMTEYRTVWPALRQGGVILSDDVNNPAFPEFCRHVGVIPYLMEQEKQTVIGIAQKP